MKRNTFWWYVGIPTIGLLVWMGYETFAEAWDEPIKPAASYSEADRFAQQLKENDQTPKREILLEVTSK